MKPTGLVSRLALCLAVSGPLAAAWPKWFPEVDAVVVRQAPTKNSATSTTAGPATQQTNLNTAKPKPTESTGTTGTEFNATDSAKPTHSDFDDRDPAGGVVMVNPPATAVGVNLYKIGDHVTFAWNYTNLQGTPTAINVLVTCTSARHIWTLTSNMTFTTAASITWDTQEQATAVEAPLLTDQYNLIILDADSSITSAPEAGYLSPYSQFKFGLYKKQEYKPLDQWNCATCSSGALSETERRVLGLAMSMSIVTVLSFTWFVTGFAGLW